MKGLSMRARSTIAAGLFFLGVSVWAFAQTAAPTSQPAVELSAAEFAHQYGAFVQSLGMITADKGGISLDGNGVISITSWSPPDPSKVREWRENIGDILEQADRAKAALATKAADADRAEKNLSAQLQSLESRPGITEESLAAKVDDLQKQLDALMYEHVSADARRSAIEDTISELSKKMDLAADADPVGSQLKEVVAARQQQFEELQKMSGKGLASSVDVTTARAELADASAKLADRKEQATAAAGGTEIASLDHELVELVIAHRERMAKISFVKDQLEAARKTLGIMSEINNQEALKMNAKAEMSEFESMLGGARQSYANLGQKLDAPATKP
jgi:hypothetical protein